MQPTTRIYDGAQTTPVKVRFTDAAFAPSFRWLLAAEQNGLLKTEDGFLIII